VAAQWDQLSWDYPRHPWEESEDDDEHEAPRVRVGEVLRQAVLFVEHCSIAKARRPPKQHKWPVPRPWTTALGQRQAMLADCDRRERLALARRLSLVH
jgi:hypothetical protein